MLPADVEEALLARAIKAFTKASFDSENGPYIYNTLKKVFKQTLEEKRKRLKEGTENSSWFLHSYAEELDGPTKLFCIFQLLYFVLSGMIYLTLGNSSY